MNTGHGDPYESEAKLHFELVELSKKYDHFIFMETLSSFVTRWISKKTKEHLRKKKR